MIGFQSDVTDMTAETDSLISTGERLFHSLIHSTTIAALISSNIGSAVLLKPKMAV